MSCSTYKCRYGSWHNSAHPCKTGCAHPADEPTQNCPSGKCDMFDQTKDVCLAMVSSDPTIQGAATLLMAVGDGNRKDLLKGATHAETFAASHGYKACKFVPHGHNPVFDQAVASEEGDGWRPTIFPNVFVTTVVPVEI